jgi:putative membrane protein
MSLVIDLAEAALYSCIGIVLMALGNFLIDLIIPCSFPEEIKKGNKAVGFVSAGTNISGGIILRAAVASPEAEDALDAALATGIVSSLLYFVAGILFFMLGYIVIDKINRQYRLSEEIGKGNTAAGIMVAGIFIGLSAVISGVII